MICNVHCAIVYDAKYLHLSYTTLITKYNKLQIFGMIFPYPLSQQQNRIIVY